LGEDEAVKQKTYYNLGNSLYKFGAAKEEINPEMTVKAFEESVKSFEKAVQLDEEDADAKSNYNFLVNEIERVKAKLEKQQSKQCPHTRPSR
jgi:tetratricopeptide (TPR) repeat protein